MRAIYVFSVLVLLRFALPFFPANEFSLVRWAITPESSSQTRTAVMTWHETSVPSSPALENAGVQPENHLTLFETGALGWFVGFWILMLFHTGSYLRFFPWLRHQPQATDTKLLRLVDVCGGQIGVRRKVPVHLVDRMRTPAVFGFFQPRILLPEQLVFRLADGDLKHVLLHELSHIRRHDTLWGVVATLVGVVHWLNPLVWLAVRQFSADRELLCDRAVLDTLGESPRANRAYGETLIRILSLFSQSTRCPTGVVPIFTNRNEIKNRMNMIAKPKRTNWLGSLLGLATITGFAVIGITLASPAKEQQERGEHREGREGKGKKERGEHDREGRGEHRKPDSN